MSEQDQAVPWGLAESGTSDHVTAAELEITTLFDQSRSALLRYLLSLGLPAHEAEEVMQEAFLALFRHLRAGKPQRNLRGWLFRVCHNLGLKRRFAARREAASAAIEEVAALCPDPAENPEEQLLTRQQQQRFQAILRALPDRDRWCLSLRAEGLRYREIAEILDMSLGAVATSLARSLARLSRADAG